MNNSAFKIFDADLSGGSPSAAAFCGRAPPGGKDSDAQFTAENENSVTP